MIGREAFRQMKRTAYFVSTARGGVHKEDDLVEALRQGRIAGAGLDVFSRSRRRPIIRSSDSTMSLQLRTMPA